MGLILSRIKNEKLRQTIRAEIDGKNLAARLPDTEPKRDVGKALEPSPPNEGRSGASLEVSITRFSRRLLDADNFAGGCKFLIDAMRYRGLIPNDDPGSIDLRFRQVRVSSKKEEGTLIEIER